MAAPLSITMNIDGEALATDYRYSPNMTPSISGVNELYILPTIRLTRNDLVKGGEYSTASKVTDNDLIRLLGKPQSLIRAMDYAEARGETAVKTLAEAKQEKIIDDNLQLVFNLLFKKGKNIILDGRTYTIYASNLDLPWTEKKRVGFILPTIHMKVSISVTLGERLGVLKQTRLSCSGNRKALRESVKKVFGSDLMGDPERSKTVVRRLIAQQSEKSKGDMNVISDLRKAQRRRYLTQVRREGLQYPYLRQLPGEDNYSTLRRAVERERRERDVLEQARGQTRMLRRGLTGGKVTKKRRFISRRVTTLRRRTSNRTSRRNRRQTKSKRLRRYRN